jgi:hypothetical protein
LRQRVVRDPHSSTQMPDLPPEIRKRPASTWIRDLIQTSLLIDARFLALAVLLDYRFKSYLG